VAKITDDEWEKLEAGFDTRQLLDVIDDVDVLRSALNDDGHQPPEIRNRLLKLHGLAMEVVNEGSQHNAQELFDLDLELEDEALDMLEAITRIHETLSTLTALRPEGLDDDDDDDDDEADDDN